VLNIVLSEKHFIACCLLTAMKAVLNPSFSAAFWSLLLI